MGPVQMCETGVHKQSVVCSHKGTSLAMEAKPMHNESKPEGGDTFIEVRVQAVRL